MDELLWSWHKDIDYGRVSGIFLASQYEIDLVFTDTVSINLIEEFGKHSEVELFINKSDFKLIQSSSKLTIEEKVQYIIGYDPLTIYISKLLDKLLLVENRDKYLLDNNLLHLKEYINTIAIGY